MGLYINPPDMTKEDWLLANASAIVPPPKAFDDRPGERYVCHVNNGPFTAAAIAFNQRELKEFTRADDRRPKQWYSVPIERLNTLPGINV